MHSFAIIEYRDEIRSQPPLLPADLEARGFSRSAVRPRSSHASFLSEDEPPTTGGEFVATATLRQSVVAFGVESDANEQRA
jgi:hypothetical protein